MDYSIIIKAVAVMAGMGAVLGIILAVASRKLAVEINPQVEAVLDVLPGSNCGACGYAGCEGAAEATADGRHGVALCVAGGQDVANQVAHVLGKDTVDVGTPVISFLKCGGGCKIAVHRYEYQGVGKCAAAHQLRGGPLLCEHGCIGFGDCVEACPFDAMIMGAGERPEIIVEKCTGCGICVQTCPMGDEDLLKLFEEGSPILVACSSHESPKATRQACSKGCIACKKCEKVCEFDAIHVVDNLAEVDYEKCTSCGECVRACPTKCIIFTEWAKPDKVSPQPEAEREAVPD